MMDRFDTDDFERTLRENADKFELDPPERVWKSIYNDLHPGSKWPSLAIGIIMIIGIFWIGNTNQHSTTKQANQIVPPAKIQEDNEVGKPLSPNENKVKNTNTGTDTETKTINNQSQPGREINSNTVTFSGKESAPVTRSSGNEKSDIVSGRWIAPLAISLPVTGSKENTGVPGVFKNLNSITGARSEISISKELQTGNTLFTAFSIDQPEISLNSKMERADRIPFESQQANLEINRKKVKKYRKAEWTFFVTPVITNVRFGGSNLNQPSSLVVVNPSSPHQMDLGSLLGFQAGTNVGYKINDFLSFYSGVHVNYGGYNIQPRIVHPTLATVTFKRQNGDFFTKNYVTYLSNKPGEGNTNIRNYSLQLGVPAGLELTLFSNPKIKWSISSDIEPFVVVSSSAYILSGDGSSFVSDPDILRRMNLNGDFATTLTLSGKDINWKIGPAVQYQILSTYSHIYNVKEHLFSYGLRLGLSKKN